MKNYWFDTQKGKIIRIMFIKWVDEFYEDFELEKYKKIFVWNNSWPRLSELLKAWIVEVEYYENPYKYKGFLWYKRAKYRLKNEFIEYYKELYNIKNHFWIF